MLRESISLHELNNVLTVVSGAAQQISMCLQGTPDEFLRKKIAVLQQAVARAALITRRSSWDFAQTENRVNDIAAQAREMQGVLSTIAGGWGTLCIDADKDCPAFADPVEVEGILINLVKNAAEALEHKGTIEVAIKAENCNTVCSTCGTHIKGTHVVVEVTDNGRGIPPENIGSVFERGYTTKNNGHGLGLYNIRIRAHLMGGHVTVASSPEGTTFKVYLLAASQDQRETKAKKQSSCRQEGCRFCRKQRRVCLD